MKRIYLTFLILFATQTGVSGCAGLSLLNSEAEPGISPELSFNDYVKEVKARKQQKEEEANESASDSLKEPHTKLVLGMEMHEVLSVWGQPRDVEHAGDAHSGNQRWTYTDGLSSPWSTAQLKRVYFEEGRVSGWETSSR